MKDRKKSKEKEGREKERREKKIERKKDKRRSAQTEKYIFSELRIDRHIYGQIDGHTVSVRKL